MILPTGPTLYVLIAAAVITVGSIGTAAYQHQRAERYQVEMFRAEDAAKSLAVSVKSKDIVIGQLQDGLNKWQALADTSTQAADAAAQKITALEAQLLTKKTTIQQIRESDHALPKCEDLLKIDLSAVCPGNAVGLRRWSAGGFSGSDSGEASAGLEEARQPAH